MNLPETLNDGTFDYNLVRQEKDLPGGLQDVALYERVPQDPDRQFTPDLQWRIAFSKGQKAVPMMQPLSR